MQILGPLPPKMIPRLWAGECRLNPGSSPGDGDDLQGSWLPSPQELS